MCLQIYIIIVVIIIIIIIIIITTVFIIGSIHRNRWLFQTR